MASAIATVKGAANHKLTVHDHDPGATTAKLAGPDGGTTIRYVDMRDFAHLEVMVSPSVLGDGTGGLTKVEIVASADATFAAVTVITDSGTIAKHALEDAVYAECTAAEISALGAAAGVKLRYAAARVTMGHANSEAKVIYLAGDARFPRAGLTASTA